MKTKTPNQINVGDLILWKDDVTRITVAPQPECGMWMIAGENGWPNARFLRVGYYRAGAQLRIADSEAEAREWASSLLRGDHFIPTAQAIAQHA